jgi:hypothetical protein
MASDNIALLKQPFFFHLRGTSELDDATALRAAKVKQARSRVVSATRARLLDAFVFGWAEDPAQAFLRGSSLISRDSLFSQEDFAPSPPRRQGTKKIAHGRTDL